MNIFKLFATLLLACVTNFVPAQSVSVDPPNTVNNICPGGAFKNLGRIKIKENLLGNFGPDSTELSTYVIALPTGFIFDTSSTNLWNVETRGTILLQIDTSELFVDSLRFTLRNYRGQCDTISLPDCPKKGEIRIEGLRVGAYQNGTGHIRRIGGSAQFLGNSVAHMLSHGELSTSTIFSPMVTSGSQPIAVDTLCFGEVESYSINTGSQSVQSIQWNTGSAQNSITVGVTGKYWATVEYQSGCIVQSDTVEVYVLPDNPPVMFPGPSATLCENDTIVIGVSNIYSSFLWTTGETTASISVDSTKIYSVIVTDQYGCEYMGSISVFGPQSAVPAITGNRLTCDGESVFLHAVSGANWEWNTGETTRSIEVTQNGIFWVKVIDIDSCVRISANDTVVFQPLPEVDFLVPILCADSLIEFEDNSTMSGNDTIAEWFWEYGDQGVGIGETSTHQYASPGSYLPRLTVTTTLGCENDTTKPLVLGASPSAQFSWSNICNGNSTQFIDETPINVDDSIISWLWDFGDSQTSTNPNPINTYQDTGRYDVTLTVETAKGCVVQKELPVHILPIENQFPYTEGFENGSGGWVAGGTKSSWVRGKPAGAHITGPASGDYCFITGDSITAYNDHEKSWIYSPCFDLRSLNRPMLAFDYNLKVEPGVDGMTLQFSIDQGLSWIRMDSMGAGINWFDTPNITGKPGDENIGWAVNTNGWRKAKYKLDGLKAEPEVRFRFSFGSDGTNNDEGAAIDNFVIQEREKFILLEQFTNSSHYPDPSMNAHLANMIAKNWQDMAGIFYHVGIQGIPNDTFYLSNTSEPGARQAQYGISSPPRSVLEGALSPVNVIRPWSQEMLDTLMLQTPIFQIDTNLISLTDFNSIQTVSAQVTYVGESQFNRDVKVHVVLVEATVNGIVGFNMETQFPWVMKKMMPDQPGIGPSFPFWAQGTTMNISESWSLPEIFDHSRLGVVIFVQDVDSGWVYQAAYKGPRVMTPVIDDSESDWGAKIHIFPNPAREYVTIESDIERIESIRMISTTGQQYQLGTPKSRLVRVNLETLSSGLYLLEVKTRNGKCVKRLVVE